MTKEEFIKTASKMGYCSKKVAEEYAEGKDTFTNDDFIEVYRIAETHIHKDRGTSLGDGAYMKRGVFRDGGEEGNR